MATDDKRNEPKSSKDYYDMTEEASKRPGDEEATTAARMAENDDVGGLPPDTPDGDNWAENKVAVDDDD